jgi:demethoxyubiquinone hydroxylase (CLK1/Coq7/Cat5 family)
LEFFWNMILADEEHDNTVASNIKDLQQQEHSHLDKLLKVLLELQVRVSACNTHWTTP